LQRQPNPLLQSPSRSQQRRMATPEPDLDWGTFRDDLLRVPW
jgi:hypothetical protein